MRSLHLVDVGLPVITQQITMPSGRFLRVQSSCAYCQQLSITAYAISEDNGQTDGLCGNSNGNSADDTIPLGGLQPDVGNEPIQFSKSYM